MTILVIGGSGSGKSAWAEKLTDELAEHAGGGKYYLATMQVRDGESRRKVERHREKRSGKGYCTLEQPRDIQKAAARMRAGENTVLLECISNLTANEMFSGQRPKSEREVTERIVRGVAAVRQAAAHLVIVSNNVFEDGMVCDETTMAYIRAMGCINRRLARSADRVVEVVVGIPVEVKQGMPL